jgi:hypothetical protein
MLFIGSPQKFAQGTIKIGDSSGNTRIIDFSTDAALKNRWQQMQRRGLMTTLTDNGPPAKYSLTPIWIGANNEFNMLTYDGTDWFLTRDYSGGPSVQTYRLQLDPAVLPNQEPRLLARNIVIDLDQSYLPESWYTVSGGTRVYPRQFDVLFSPRGTVTGTLSSWGLIHFALADVEDTTLDRPLGAANKERGELIVTLTTQTGNINSHPVYSQQWLDNRSYKQGDWVSALVDHDSDPNTPDEPRFYEVTAAGTSGTSQPAWPANNGATVTDNGVTWTCRLQNGGRFFYATAGEQAK